LDVYLHAHKDFVAGDDSLGLLGHGLHLVVTIGRPASISPARGRSNPPHAAANPPSRLVDTRDMAATKTPSQAASRPLDDLLTDRRRMLREPVTAKGFVSINALDEEAGHLVNVVDLSLRGVGFRSPVALGEGDMHQIIIMAGPLRLSSRLRVAFCRLADDGWFDIGAEFK
jgi:hypothetical protein